MSVTFQLTGAWDPDYSLDLELNFSNENAAAILFSLNRFEDENRLEGLWNQTDIDQIIKRVIKILNTRGGINVLLKDPYQDGNIHYGGRDEDYVKRRLNELLTLCLLAKLQKTNISFF